MTQVSKSIDGAQDLGPDYADLDSAVAVDLVAANHILAHNGVLDSFGHVSIRDPRNPNQYLQIQAIAPRDAAISDLITFDLDSNAINARGRPIYRERFIHGQVYKMRPDVKAVVHSHSLQRDRKATAGNLPQRPLSRPGHARLGNPRSCRRAKQHAGAEQRTRQIAGREAGQGFSGPDARAWQCSRRTGPQDGGLPRDLYRGERQA